MLLPITLSKVTDLEKREIYKDNFAEYLLCLALDVGEGMLRSGAEISRVEDSIERICRAYGAAHVEVFTIISFINAAIRMPDGSYSSQMRRIKSTSTNLGMLEKLNALSRKICRELPALEAFDAEVKELKKSAFYRAPLLCFASGLAAGGFAMLFGGRWNDGILAFIIGIIIELVDLKMPKRVNVMAKTVISSAIAAAIAILAERIGLAASSDYVIIGAIMLLVPGVAFGTAMRDLLYGDLLAGTLKTLQAILLALMIAFGYMISVELLSFFGISIEATAPAAPDFETFFKPIFFIASVGAAVGAVSFAVLFKVAPRHLVYGMLAGLITYVVYYIVEFYTEGMAFPAAFVSTMCAALFAEIASRTRKAPTIVFLIPAVIPTVPGGMLYRAMRALLLLDFGGALEALLVTLQIGLGIAGGILTVSIIFGSVMERIRKGKAK